MNIFYRLINRLFPYLFHYLRYVGIVRVNYNINDNLNFRSIDANNTIKELILNSKSILEFGSGHSTLFYKKNGKKYMSFETDKDFFRYMSGKTKVNFINIGITSFYSIPYKKNAGSIYYSEIIKNLSYENLDFDLIIIDGRFRVLTSLIIHKILSKKKNLSDPIILLDDYKNRSHYHILKNYYEIKLINDIAKMKIKIGKFVDDLELKKFMNDYK